MGTVINATGIIWHEELKIPPLPREAVDVLQDDSRALRGKEVCLFEKKGLRKSRAEEMAAYLTGAEDALIVNSLAAAAFLLVSTFAREGEVFAWGEDHYLGERLPSLFSLLNRSNASLKNTYPHQALADKNDENYSLFLHVKNKAPCSVEKDKDESLELIHDFTKGRAIPLAKLCECASLVDLTPYGLRSGLKVQEHLNRGIDIVLFSGDKFLGGPPTGIIAGDSRYLSVLRNEMLSAALAPDKMVEAALEATMELYLNGEDIFSKLPFLRMLCSPLQHVWKRANSIAEKLEEVLSGDYKVEIVPGKASVSFKDSQMGTVSSYQLVLNLSHHSPRQLGELIYRKGNPPVVPYIKEEALLLDLRSVLEEEDHLLLDSLVSSLSENSRDQYLLHNLPALIWVLDHGNKILYANKACEDFWSKEKVIGCRLEEVFPSEVAAVLAESKERALNEDNQEHVEIVVRDSSGEERYFEVVLSPVSGKGETEVSFNAFEVTRYKNQEAELFNISMHDSMTGLYNRAYFDEEMRRLNNERHYPISFVLFDVDGLKLINDILGHDKGDELLKKAAEIIKKPFRKSDVVARVGGDEFAVILPSTGDSTVQNIAKRLRNTVETYNLDNEGMPLSLSIGYATGEEPSIKLEDIFKKADSEMYDDKYKRAEVVKKEIFDSLLNLLAQKDFQNESQVKKLQRMVLLLGQAVGIPRHELKNILLLARVYDIGKINVDDEIIFKNGGLSPAEWEKMKKHPEIGYRIARNLPQTTDIAEYILQHHEWWNGSGYPQGLKGEDIHLYSRILSVVDAYEAMRNPRPFRPPLSHEEALSELKKHKGIQFDPRIVDIFATLVEEIEHV